MAGSIACRPDERPWKNDECAPEPAVDAVSVATASSGRAPAAALHHQNEGQDYGSSYVEQRGDGTGSVP